MGSRLARAQSQGPDEENAPATSDESGIEGVSEDEAQSVELQATRLERELYNTPYAVTHIDREAINLGQQRLRLDESLRMVPGALTQNRDNFAQGQRIAIRGAGARAPFGVRGIAVIVDGVPYTLPDGQSQIDAIDLDAAQSIEVIRGPSSVLYGNAAGGVIRVTTVDGRTMQGAMGRVGAGSDGYVKANIVAADAHGPWSYGISGSATAIEGYRAQSEAQKYLMNVRLTRSLGDGKVVGALVNLLANPRAEDPGGLKLEEAEADRAQAAPGALATDSGQSVSNQIASLYYEDAHAGPGALRVQGFYTHRDFEQQLPYIGDSLLGYARHHVGGQAEYRHVLSWDWLRLRYIAGLDVAHQRDDRTRRAIDDQAIAQELTVEEVQQATSVGGFWQGDIEPIDHVIVSVGGRYDRIALEVEDDLLSDGDDGGARVFDVWSATGGVSYRYARSHQVYASTATSYETPTFAEFADPSGQGGLNPEIEPSRSWNREVGARGHVGWGLTYDASLFSVIGYDELVPYEQAGRVFYENAGRTRREGVEAMLGWAHAPSGVHVDSAWTIARYQYTDFVQGDQVFDGNDLPGLPNQVVTARLGWRSAARRFAVVEGQYVGDQEADSANEVTIDGYALLNARAGWGWPLDEQGRLFHVYGGVRNLMGTDYAGNVRLNASFGRYIEPAPGRTGYVEAGVSF